MVDLLVSVVTYRPDLAELKDTLESLVFSLEQARRDKLLESAMVVLVDNGPDENSRLELEAVLSTVAAIFPFVETDIISGQGNVGFGAGHNLAAAAYPSRFYLVLNPDVVIDLAAIGRALSFLEENPEVGLISPCGINFRGSRLDLCKRFPNLFDLALRGFAPSWAKSFFSGRLATYEMRDVCGGDSAVTGIPIVSGCFMFMRRRAWDMVGGFDPRYFLYFEDFDFSLRLGEKVLLAHVPAVKIKHLGGDAARKGIKHVKMFLASARTFFSIWGLRLW